MTGLNDRQKAFEDRFAQDQELQFKVQARRNKLLGLWAAEKLGKEGDEAEEYAKSVVISDFAEPGDDDVLRKVLVDFEDAELPIDRQELRHEMDRLMRVAMDQIMNEA
ncbi:MAG: DUF1476 domain-containing protein [Rickettsiales bacterium]|nr:DUF1476 domain-containing protein [Rickettsiales bacterium]